jgi:hypothetical protein
VGVGGRGPALPLGDAAARRALDERTARRLGLDVREAALGVHRGGAATVVRAVKAVSTFLAPDGAAGPSSSWAEGEGDPGSRVGDRPRAARRRALA